MSDEQTPVVQPTQLRVTSMSRKVLQEQPVLRIRGTWDMQGDEPNPISPAIGEIDAVIERGSLNVAGPPYWICPDGIADNGAWRWEAGFPVGDPGTDDGRVEAAMLPGGEVASIYYAGRFERGPEVHAYLRAQIEAAGLQPEGEPRWIGLTDPAIISSPDEHYSELIWPVTKAP